MLVFTNKRLRPVLLRFPVGLGVDVDWLIAHNVTPIGTSQDQNSLFWDCPETICFDPEQQVPVETVEGFHEVVDALRKLPESLLQGFNNQKDGSSTQIYFSTQTGRSLMITGYYYYGLILEQRKTIHEIIVHEYAHVVDNIGIRGMEWGYDYPPIWNLADEVNKIFDAQGDLISPYARTNTFEDFAEHFRYYVWKGTTFRTKALTNPDLAERYGFLKQNLFEGVEYEEPPPPPVTKLEGFVIDQSGKPLEGADVLAKSAIMAPMFIGITDETGYFLAEGVLPEGEYIVWAQMHGTKGEEITVSLMVGAPIEVALIVKWQPVNLGWLIPITAVCSVIGGIIYLTQNQR